jgi:hypothetical protein
LKDSSMITKSWVGKANNIHYTFSQGEDVGAGQRYTSMCYVFSWTNVNYVIDFEVHSHLGCQNSECWAYCGTQYEQECRSFDMTNDVTTPIDTIISTIKIIK